MSSAAFRVVIFALLLIGCHATGMESKQQLQILLGEHNT